MKIGEKKILAYALEDGLKHDEAKVQAVLGKLFLEGLEKSQIRDVMPTLQKVVKKVNGMSKDKRQKEFDNLKGEVKERKHEQRDGLPELKNGKVGKVVMRVAPSASGPLHIGHAYPFSLNSEFCKMYKGKLIVRVEDTNPENIDVKAYDLIKEDMDWLTGGNVSSFVIQSDRMEKYYKYAERLLKEGDAYVCTCSQVDFKKFSDGKKECMCRSLSAKENIDRWKRMFKEKDGWGVMRIKTDMQHKNPAMRDFPAFRINHTPHPRTKKKYTVWPLMNFAVAIDDLVMGVTHTLRGKDHFDNATRQGYIFKYFEHKSPEHLFVGRVNFEGMPLSTSETAKKIKAGNYSGWSDIRLPFLQAMKKKGYRAEALRKFYVSMGVGLNDKSVKREDYFQLINSYNKEIINEEANRYFFIGDPVMVRVEEAPELNVGLKLHPSFPKRGKRNFKTSKVFYLSKSDVNFKENKMYRLMDCLNFVKKGKKLVFHSKEYTQFKEKGESIMHWLPMDAKQLVSVKVLMDNGKWMSGLAEKGVSKLKIGTAIQFERFGFCVKTGKNEFWFTHK
ncbi:glutamate--tRNA ligase [Nanoarchaeota archaeon]